MEAYSQGDGASWVPAKAFDSGETVVVHGKLSLAGKSYPFAFHFTTAVRDPIGHPASSPKPAGKPAELFSFHSQPNLHVPIVTVDSSSPAQTQGDLFIAPYSGPGQDGPMIVDSSGNLVWFDPLPPGIEATNLQVQSYEGKPALTWWQGYIPPQGFGQGEEVIANTSYQQILKFRAGNGLLADLHEFEITPQNTAFLTVFDPIRCNLSSAGGPSNAAVTDSLFQEIDLKTHLVRREWHPLDYVALSQSYASPTGSSQEWPFDYFHLNSIAVRHDGSLLISARNTSALYELSPSTGQIIAQIGGKHGTDALGAGAATAYQHDAEELPDGDFSVFDNGAVPKVHPQSRGLVLSVNPTTKTDTVVNQYVHSAASLGQQPGQRASARRRQRVHRLGRGTILLRIHPDGRACVRRAPAAQDRVLPHLPLPLERHTDGRSRDRGDGRPFEHDRVRQLERGHWRRQLERARRLLRHPARAGRECGQVGL